MITYTWKILDLFADGNSLKKVQYLLSGTNGQVTVQSSGNHKFSLGVANKELSQIVESDIIQWLEKDTTQDDINLIKLAIENQINALESTQKIDFPWLAGTFTI